MIYEKKLALDNISRMLAIIRYDIEHHQSLNELSLNIHAENYFRDVFNFVYGCNFENTNFKNQNAPCIDLIDKSRKLAYQITTTKTKEKIEKTLNIFKNQEYNNYEIKIFYILDKSNPNRNTIDEIKSNFDIDVSSCLCDYTDLIKDIDNLEINRIIELNDKFFKGIGEKYTDEIVLNLICIQLIREKRRINPRYDDSFGSVDANEKMVINKINTRISSSINNGLDYTKIIENIGSDDNLLTDLRSLIVDDLYKKVLVENLKCKVSKKELLESMVIDLHRLSYEHNIDFNKIIGKLHETIEGYIEINDFNTMNIAWIIIAYFFEICDIGVHQT